MIPGGNSMEAYYLLPSGIPMGDAFVLFIHKRFTGCNGTGERMQRARHSRKATVLRMLLPCVYFFDARYPPVLVCRAMGVAN